MSDEPRWLTIARQGIGQREIPGSAENGWIVNLWKKIKRGGIKSEDVPWCAAFVGACLEDAGIRSSRFESAISYATWGVSLRDPVHGCIAVFTRDGGGHVGFVVGQDAMGRVLILGGNQGNAVSIAAFPRNRVVAWRWPSGEPIPMGRSLALASAAASTSEA